MTTSDFILALDSQPMPLNALTITPRELQCGLSSPLGKITLEIVGNRGHVLRLYEALQDFEQEEAPDAS